MGSFSLKGDPLSTQLRRGLVNANSTATSLRLLKRLARQHRTAFIRLWQSAVITTCLTVAFWLRFDFVIPDPEMHRLLLGIGIALVVKLTVFNFIGNDKGW